MIFNVSGGGGTALNFRVVGGTVQPENPRENTIWLNTDVPIRSWQFASDDPNLLDFSNWANEVTVTNGTKGVSGGTFTLTATANDCYTDFSSTRATNIPCTPGKTYVMEWEHSGANGEVYIFPNGNVDGLVMAGEASGKIEFTPTDGISFFTFRFGARIANTTATYSNIRITEKDRAFKPGGVWILTGASPHVEFNALKKNGIQVYPISAKQYVDGAWVDKDAKIYQSGEWKGWIDWDKWIVKDGIYKLPMVAEGKPYDPSYSSTTFTVTEVDGGIRFDQGSGTGMVYWGPFDLTDATKLTIEGDFRGKNSACPTDYMLAVWKSIGTQINTFTSKVQLTDTGATLSVSSLTGEYYVGFTVRNVGYEIVTNLYAE